MKKIYLIFILILLPGCAAEVFIVSYEESGERLVGTIYERIEVISEKNGAVCIGEYEPTTQPIGGVGLFSCEGIGGVIKYTCDDGRKAMSETMFSSCSSGYGSGIDSNGDKFNVYFGPDVKAAIAKPSTTQVE
ncbi:MAG: hypothetical protein OQJ97_12385 [Rhodospirillales bacterium]|nr:hypothetical protein [Rhodospirillales bacterium]